MNATLRVLNLDGIRLRSLGQYLTGLGVLAAVSRRWASVRGCWRNGHFVLLEGTLEAAALENFLLSSWTPTQYELWWTSSQKADTKSKSDANVKAMRDVEPEDSRVRVLDCHIVGVHRNHFNPVLGTGGNIGKRNLARARQDALRLVQSKDGQASREWLRMTLFGCSGSELPDLSSAGTWFVHANKMFNSGQDWYREGRISPWSVMLSTEGALLLCGTASRRLGSHPRPYAVFPFVSEAASPESDVEVGLQKAEFWAPVWERPADLAEVCNLISRGLARVGRRCAKSPYEFALAARSSGADAGVERFERFVLRHTTSAQVYEAIPRESIRVARSTADEARLIEPVLTWMDRLPFEPRDAKQRGKFVGLRGPVEACIVQIAARPGDSLLWQRMLALLAESQGRIDRNKELRDRCRAVPWLHPIWFEKAWPQPPAELLVARAIASVGAATDLPLQANVFGVILDPWLNQGFAAKGRPQRAVWHSGNPLRALGGVLERRLIDSPPESGLPLRGRCLCPADLVQCAVGGGIDFEEVARWLPALSLIDWTRMEQTVPNGAAEAVSAEGDYLLYALFKPFFHPQEICLNDTALFRRLPRAATARTLLNLIRTSDWRQATQFARSRYLAAGRSTVDPSEGIRADAERTSAALLIPMRSVDVAKALRCWLYPRRNVN